MIIYGVKTGLFLRGNAEAGDELEVALADFRCFRLQIKTALLQCLQEALAVGGFVGCFTAQKLRQITGACFGSLRIGAAFAEGGEHCFDMIENFFGSNSLRHFYTDAGSLSLIHISCETLSRLAEENDADLMLVASHRKGFLKRALMGSTTYELARATMIPLLINKDEEDEVTENLLDTVLIPTDFSRKSLEALNVIRSLSLIHI